MANVRVARRNYVRLFKQTQLLQCVDRSSCHKSPRCVGTSTCPISPRCVDTQLVNDALTYRKYHSVPYGHYDGWTRGDENRIPQEVLVSTDQYIRGDRGYDCSIDKAINIYLPAKWLADHMGLRWNGVEGYFFDDSGDLIAFDPSVRTPGPGALLINRDALLKFLNENGYDILWTVVGEKNIIGGRRDDWKGRLELSGAYRIHENQIDGAINTRFLSRD